MTRSSSVDASRDQEQIGVERTIASIAARVLGAKHGTVDPTMPFGLMGLDSLGTIELSAALEDALGIELTPEVFAECSDVRSLAVHVRDRGRRPAAVFDPADAMLADSVLPADVQPEGRAARSTTGGLLKAKGILVTGATGFLGGQLVADLLTRSSARLFCLVRQGPRSPRTRLLERVTTLGVTPATFDARVTVVTADLASPQPGLTEAALDSLGDSIDAILHAAASVNWVLPYASMRSTNVTGTLELLRVACRRSIPFHFVSSISVCYPACGPDRADEGFDPLDHRHGIHLGYAQTKIAAEALVRAAGRRGLPVRIYRPSLVVGDSRTGAFNADDLLSLMIKGCVQMGAAPDLDWTLDGIPVDVVSREILTLSSCRPRTQRPDEVFHLVHGKPRHWRECLLWMRLYGYSIRLMPYHDWLRELEIETNPATPASSTHPLRSLRTFFLDRARGSLTLPELYEESRRTKAVAAWTSRLLSRQGSRPPLDAMLLERYFDAFVSAGYLRAPERAHRSRAASPQPVAFDEAFFTRALSATTATVVERAELVSLGSEHSIISELSAWQTGRESGLLRYRLHLRGTPRATTCDVLVKVKPPDHAAIAVGQALASLCDRRLGDAYARWGTRTGLLASHRRERAIYEMRDPRFQRHVPALLGSVTDEATGECVLILEQIVNAVMMDSVSHTPVWSREHLEVAIRGLAELHAVWYRRTSALLGEPWLGFVQTADGASEMTEFWAALADHAAPCFSQWTDRSLLPIQTRLIESIQQWRTVLDESARTLIHHDFNPRNICLRIERADVRGFTRTGRLFQRGQPRLCAYDWELATVGAPQRDLAELLCFVLPATATDDEIDFWIDRHRSLLASEAGCGIDPVEWRRGFAAALYDVLIDRLAMYALVHRVKPQTFLPRVVRSWRRLYERFPLLSSGS